MTGTLVAVLAVVLVLGAIVVVWRQATRVRRERHRVAAETLVAEWRLRAVTRSAMQQMLDVARQHSTDQHNR